MQESEPSQTADGHAGARAILTVEERIAHIVGMMERFEWVRGKSGPLLAAQWGVSLSVVEKASAEASRRCTANADDVRRDISLGGLQLLREALREGRAGDFTKVGELLASVSGAKAPEHRINTNVEANPTDAARLVREAFGEKAAPKTNGVTNGANGHSNGHG